jgi:hypothetical protein
MGIVDFAKSIYHNVSFEREVAARQKNGIALKMDLFIAQYPGKVIDPGIPLAVGIKNKAKRTRSLYVNSYVRLEFSHGGTRFEWFHDIWDAHDFVAELRSNSDSNVTAIIGPHLMPVKEHERFR